MMQPLVSEAQESIIHNCLLDLLESSSLNNASFLPKALESILDSRGFGIEMSGIYISTDEDSENIPDYLRDGISFEFMEDHVTLPFNEAVSCIVSWCKKNVKDPNPTIYETLKKLEEKFN